ncbi:IclR family transcriptional regulator [Burkholderia vietnamiensis]|jgi:DNA-binding IclR family transcriptional regulator|uniref:IclR family transcriptional regulator n=1 Tax=Burkholderia vietnamiensis TaxID=60552 RepID=UPI00075318F8|nr:IclR family transcriptional regulator [Burkholderia vietnamiensis]AOJ17049.1 IclR family transcriptional regulator [Burkholderia vietnamiensis]KVF02964.1 IclR family transcriptional regulator [Burkholderia vietnamiensis]MBR8219902.1 IclR family transcriptional regulator [Burkholderia vietnamiensis]MBR8282208.1 IclR family transcriptional regulator [Burkholderia vietnamiensis]MCA8016770.1 IclR family transcriptional regulator [Burkholderia vietnamiensis]
MDISAADDGAQTGPDLLFNQSLEKGLSVLRAFSAKRRTMTLAEIAEAASMSKSSAQRMVYTLEKLGYIRKHPLTRRYQLTPRVMQIGFNYLAADTLIDVANPFLSELTNITGETTNLTEPDGDEMVYVSRFVSTKFVPIHMPIGSRIPMYCTGSGRAFLGALPVDEALARLEQMNRVAFTPNTVTDLAPLGERLAQARQQGYATNREELFIGDMSIAAPVVGSQGRPVAAVHVVAPTSRWAFEDARQRLAPAVIDCARGISNSIRTLE